MPSKLSPTSDILDVVEVCVPFVVWCPPASRSTSCSSIIERTLCNNGKTPPWSININNSNMTQKDPQEDIEKGRELPAKRSSNHQPIY